MGPLQGITIIEIVGLGPGPFCAMLLADMGATVIRVDRPGAGVFGDYGRPELDFLNRGKQSIAVNLKSADGVKVVERLLKTADGLVEGFRPGVMEKLGLGPDACMQGNPALVYGRMTGWGQDGPLAQSAGHDINYIALAGALHGIGHAGQKPAIPMNLVGDFGGGGLMLAFGMVCALLDARSSGQGQVVDAAMIDGAATLMTSTFAAFQANFWNDQRGTNMLDGGAHFYDVYETADGKFVSFGSIEPQFYAELLEKLGEGASENFAEQFDIPNWPKMKEQMEALIKTRTRDEWDNIFSDSNVCYAPVLSMSEVKSHPHHQARETFLEDDEGVWQPRPAPRFSRSKPENPSAPVMKGENTAAVLASYGFSESEVQGLIDEETIFQK